MIVDDIYKNNDKKILIKRNMRSRGILSMRSSIMNFNSNKKIGIIAEFKRRSPSGFVNNENTDIFKYYDVIHNSIAGMSILTEERYFNGNQMDVVSVQRYNIPILIKDFVSNDEMIESSYMIGGDVILLIADFLERDKIEMLNRKIKSLGMEALIEFHDLKAFERITTDENVIIGYNRRNLKTLKIEDESFDAHDLIRSTGLLSVLESGITSENILKMPRYNAMLIGSSILSNDSVLKSAGMIKYDGFGYS
ncbi:indole-3-glycerol phosphate synthase TrpC [Picrophilus oshimae]|uniref:Indole-3-glycerol phosphate synthase n=1 Tax=Picrophilus torridus (strain ATCC 700027 / DSM 9790 / JCM 10055 / NBRC 100828 / KAW 2/3) TaxID=1122961 RepID=A0A8G2L7A4_PICTO|nr:indole-3-glycerol phosphate synthase TrpC [Picrophilus oshimae]SMD30760.1 indole-3-glycerol phosphate synthase [Picrophilus oshimae DSM 9789]